MIKKEIAQKMIQHTHYDRKTGKMVKTMIPESKEHKEMSKHLIKKVKEPNEQEKRDYQHRIGRAYSE